MIIYQYYSPKNIYFFHQHVLLTPPPHFAYFGLPLILRGVTVAFCQSQAGGQ